MIKNLNIENVLHGTRFACTTPIYGNHFHQLASKIYKLTQSCDLNKTPLRKPQTLGGCCQTLEYF